MIGDLSLRNVTVQADRPHFRTSDSDSSSAAVSATTPSMFDDCVFRVCPKMSYRARGELKVLEKVISAAKPEHVGGVKRRMKYDACVQRAENEASQNAELLHKAISPTSGEDAQHFPIKYGDVIMLQHRRSGQFVSLHKTPAFVNANNRRVSLKRGATAGHFRIMPRFKVRSVGSTVYSNDEIVLQSVKFETLFLGASGTPRNMLMTAPAAPELQLRVPSVLDALPKYEVNGSLELRSFRPFASLLCDRSGASDSMQCRPIGYILKTSCCAYACANRA